MNPVGDPLQISVVGLPAGYEAAAVAIVVQSLVELVGMALLAGWVPSRVFPSRDPAPAVGPP